MIHGNVDGLQAHVDGVFRLSGQPDLRIECVVDTGFEGALTLPTAAVAAMGLPLHGQIDANLADDSNISVDVHRATILWDGREVEVAVLAMGRRPLVGTPLLDGFHLGADFTDGGAVSLQRL